MDSRYKLTKTRCSICGRTVKKVLQQSREYNDTDFYKADDGSLICKLCEYDYHLLDNFNHRGYGYKFSTDPKMTVMDTGSTPTFGIELEVAGNIKNIDKIEKITGPTRECSIGYDTSVEGAQFELSYCPGTYYWYLYESKLQAVCALLQKDNWTKKSESIGTHIHIGRIHCRRFLGYMAIEAERNPLFWKILEIIGERKMNEYCAPRFRNDHHDAISWSRWGTLEFRFFAGTYDFDTIMKRMRFMRQIIDTSTDEGINWGRFNPEVKDWMFTMIKRSSLGSPEQKKKIKEILEGETKHFIKLNEFTKNDIFENLIRSDGDDDDEDDDYYYDD